MTERIRVLLVSESLQVGGAERQALQMVEHLDRDRFACDIALLGRSGPLEDEARALGMNVHFLPRRGGLDPSCVLGLDRVLREGRYHTVEGLLHYGSLVAGVAGRRAGTPVRVACNVGDRSLYANDLRAIRQRWIKRGAYALATRIMVNSDFVARTDPQLRPHRDKVRVIHNGLRQRAFEAPASRAESRAALGIDVDAPVVCAVGRLVEAKDYPTFLRAVRDTVDRGHRRLVAVIVGDGPLRDDLRRLAAGLGLDHHAHFAGTALDVRPWIVAADVVTLTSSRESLPNAVLEGMALGRVVVATAVAGVPEIVRDGVTGYLCASGDATALAARYDELLRDPGRADAMGAVAREDALARFHWNRKIREYEALLTP